MKKSKLSFSVAAIAVTGVSLSVAALFLSNKPSYVPREFSENLTKEKGINGAIEHYYNLRKNQITGQIDINDVLRAEKEVRALMASRSAGLGLAWDEMGPDNVGGRTRAFLIDPANPQRIYAGGVAGGLWVSNDGGGTWTNINDQQENLAVSWITRGANGYIYYSTGEGLAQPGGINYNSGTIGRGIFRSTDGGVTFQQLASTVPTDGNSSSVDWSMINRIEAHPTNPNIIYAGTSRGFRVSEDMGVSWKSDYIKTSTGVTVTGEVDDIDVSNDGTVIVSLNRQAYISPDGTSGSFVAKTTSSGLPSSGTLARIEFDVAKNNSNVMVAAAAKGNGQLHNVYYSGDKGVSWSIIGPGGSTFDPFGDNGQGWYDNIIRINPHNDGEVFFGGVELWRWIRVSANPVSGQWYRTAAEFPESLSNPYYVHSDKHNIMWHPTDPNTVYVITDGGISKSVDGGTTHKPMNHNYNILQCYSVAYSGVGEVMAGSQDNGTQYINFTGNTPKAANEVSGGDGMHCEISQIDHNILFATVYNGALSRTKGSSAGGGNFNTAALDSAIGKYDAAFVTPIELWESWSDPNSPDSIKFIASKVKHNFVSAGNGTQATFNDTLRKPQTSSIIVPGSVVVTCLSQVLTDVGGTGAMFSGVTNVGSVDYSTGVITVTFPVVPATNVAINVEFDVRYNSGSSISVNSNTANYPFTYTLTSDLEANDSIKIHDKVQAKLALGLTGSVWITKRALDFGSDSKWIKVANVSGTVQHMCYSKDGNHLFVATQSGVIYRLSGLSSLTDDMFTTDPDAPTLSNIIVTTLSGAFTGRSVTDVSVDPNNADHLVVTAGNYGNTTYIYRSTNATAASPTFSTKQGNLPKMPVYSAIIDKRDAKRVIIGTEYGIFSTSDITVSSPVWTSENNGFPNGPVFMVRQQTMDNDFNHNIYNDGFIYVGSHGRGIWKSETLKGPVGIKETPKNTKGSSSTSSVSIFPNPMAENGNINLNITKAVDNGYARIFDINGKLVKEIKLQNIKYGNQTIPFSVSDFSTGTYFVKITAADINLTSKFVVVK